MIGKNLSKPKPQNADLDKKADSSSDAARYITDMKELPNLSADERSENPKVLSQEKARSNQVIENINQETQSKKEATKENTDKSQEKIKEPNIVEKINTADTSVNDKNTPVSVVGDSDEDEDSGGKLDNMPFSVKDLILGTINLITIILLVVLLFRIPQKADEVRTLRNDNMKSQTKVELQSPELDIGSKKADELKSLFLDESGVVSFVSAVDKLKTGGVLTDITFQSQGPIVDKTGNSGIPVSIKLVGTWSQIEPTLVQLQNLPFLFRPVSVDATADKDGVLIFKYGGLLYVDNNIGKTR